MAMNTQPKKLSVVDTIAENLRAELHSPALPVVDIGEHLIVASRLSRALWLVLDGNHDHEFDQRDLDGLKELASTVAHHASAAHVVYQQSFVADHPSI